MGRMTSRMQFGPDDEEAFYARQKELEEDFAGWVEPLHLRVDPSDFALLLGWKWGYGDGDLGRWSTEELTEFLLGWCPRKLVVPRRNSSARCRLAPRSACPSSPSADCSTPERSRRCAGGARHKPLR